MKYPSVMISMIVMSCTIFLTCSKGSNPVSAELKPGFGIHKGQSWFYSGKTEYKRHIPSTNDSAVDFSSLFCNRDTLIDGTAYLIVEGHWYHCGNFYVDTSKMISYINIADSKIKVLSPKEDSYSPPGLGLLKYSIDTLSYDSSTFYNDSLYKDLYYPVIIPIEKATMWFYRPIKDPCGNLPMVRRYIGDEEISVPGGTFNTMKFDFDYRSWCIGDTDTNCKLENIVCTTWVASTGNVKYSAVWIDSLSDTSIYTSQLLSNSNNPVEYVKPIYPKTMIDSAIKIVSTYWSYQLFQSWLWSKPALEFDSIISSSDNFDNIVAMMKGIWNCSLGNIDEIKSYLKVHPLPSTTAEYYNYNQFVEIILSRNTFIRGWTDCDTTQIVISSRKRSDLLKYIYPDRY